MRATIYTEYGPPDVLRLIDVPTPAPGDREVLIRIRAASVNPLDWHMMEGKPLFIRPMAGGFRKPRPTRPGVDVAGQVEAVGDGVTGFTPGDEVFGVCQGAFADYACASEDKLVLKPAPISFEEAAAVPVAAVTALQGLRDHGHIQRDQQVLIDGASGGVGTFAIQIAKSFGAEVTAVCSTRNLDTARTLGADHVIDYTQEDFTAGRLRYDLIFAANARHSILAYRRALGPNGVYVMAGGGSSQILQAMSAGPVLSFFGTRKMRFFVAKITRTDLVWLKDLLDAGRMVSVIDRRYPLSDVADAVRYSQDGHARGKIVVTMDHPANDEGEQ